eukprot:13426340-Alexandrium_andersonii.AAC.1
MPGLAAGSFEGFLEDDGGEGAEDKGKGEAQKAEQGQSSSSFGKAFKKAKSGQLPFVLSTKKGR